MDITSSRETLWLSCSAEHSPDHSWLGSNRKQVIERNSFQSINFICFVFSFLFILSTWTVSWFFVVFPSLTISLCLHSYAQIKSKKRVEEERRKTHHHHISNMCSFDAKHLVVEYQKVIKLSGRVGRSECDAVKIYWCNSFIHLHAKYIHRYSQY